MAQTPSTMLALGTTAPAFSLPDPASDKIVALEDFADSPALLVAFICNHCPFVKHLRSAFAQFAREYQPLGLATVAINSNDVLHYPADGPKEMVVEARQAGYTFPYLYDASQDAAKAYRAACTPDFFLFDRERKLAYRGQLDDSRPGNGKPVTCVDMMAAVDAVLAGRTVHGEQKPSLGCNIKWKPGNEPDYF